MIITNSRFIFFVGYTHFGDDGSQELTDSHRERICQLRDSLHQGQGIHLDEVFHPLGRSSAETASMLIDGMKPNMNQVESFNYTNNGTVFNQACASLIASCRDGNLENHSRLPFHHLVHEVALEARNEIEYVLSNSVDSQCVLIVGSPVITNALIAHLFSTQQKVIEQIWSKFLKPGGELIEVRVGSDPALAELDWAANFNKVESEVG